MSKYETVFTYSIVVGADGEIALPDLPDSSSIEGPDPELRELFSRFATAKEWLTRKYGESERDQIFKDMDSLSSGKWNKSRIKRAEALLPKLGDTVYAEGLRRDLTDALIEVFVDSSNSYDDKCALLLGYFRDTSLDRRSLMWRSRRIASEALELATFDCLDALIREVPELLYESTSRGDLATEIRRASYTMFSNNEGERSIALLRWALTLRLSNDDLLATRAVLGHMLERHGQVAEAYAFLQSDWDAGVRCFLSADRLSMMATRGGNDEAARTLLMEALNTVPDLTELERMKLEKRLARLSKPH